MKIEISGDVPSGRAQFDQPAKKPSITTKPPLARPPIADTEIRPVAKSDATLTYTVGSYLAARLSQIGLKHHFVLPVTIRSFCSTSF